MASHFAGRGPERRNVFAAILVGALLLVTIGSVDAATVTVAAVNFRFEPETRTVNAGDTVRWTFAGDPHTVTSGAPGAPDGRFDSGIKDPGGSFQATFNNAGTFPYFCQIHPEQMFGTIVVSAAATPTPTAAATPTPRPTVRPTARPTAQPTARPTAAPTTAPTVTATASPTTAATATPTASAPTSSPTASPSAAAAGSPSARASESATPAASRVPDGSDAAAGLDPLPIVAIGIVVGLVVAAGVAFLRGRPAG